MTDFPLIYRAILDYQDVDKVQVSDGLIIYLSKDFTDENYGKDRELYFLPIYMCNPRCKIKPSNLVYLEIKDQAIQDKDFNYNLSVGNKIKDKDELLQFFQMVSANMQNPRISENELVLKQINTEEDIQKFLLLCKINHNIIENKDILEFMTDFTNLFKEEINKNKSRLNNELPNFYNKLIKNIMSEYNLTYGLNTEDDLPKAQHQKNNSNGNPASNPNLEGFGKDNQYNLKRLLDALKLTNNLVFSINNKEIKYYIENEGRPIRNIS